jgi:diguanylate cyclase
MQENLPKHKVTFLPLPPESDRENALKERRERSFALAAAAVELHKLRLELFTDSLTGLPNRRAFDQELPKLFETAKNNNASIALMYLDIDGLKRTNDTLGHPIGDQLLQTVAKTFRTHSNRNNEGSILRPSDIVGRFDGDEYWVILPDYKPLENQTVDELNKSKIKSIQERFEANALEIGIPKELHVGISVGISVIQPEDTLESFISRADSELRHNKSIKKQSQKDQGINFVDDRLEVS